MHNRWRVLCTSIPAILAIGGINFGQQGKVERKHDRPEPKFQVRLEPSVMVPMRDGVRLSTDLYFPEGRQDKLPVILIRTMYNKKERGPELDARMFASQGYVVAVQDVRGKYESEGNYIVSASEGKDGYDAVGWLAVQPWSTGKIGTYGCSYLGEDQMTLARLRHPNHAAMIPMASSSAYRNGAEITGGAYVLAASAEWYHSYAATVRATLVPNQVREAFLQAAPYFNLEPVLPAVDWPQIWRTLPLTDIVKKSGAPPSDYEQRVSHAPSDPYWEQFGYVKKTDRFNTPALFLDSWYDYGPGDTMELFNLLQQNSESELARQNIFAIIAPTTHCVYAGECEQTVVGQRFVGDVRLDFYGIYLRWFDYWLKGIDNSVTNMPKLQIFVMGKNQWRGEDEWPLQRTRYTKFYLHSDGNANSRLGSGSLSMVAPGKEPPDQYVYDPGTPVPTMGGPDFGTPLQGMIAGAADQSELEMRNDVLVYSTLPLEQGLEVTGPLKAVLYVSSSTRDTDFTAKLVDVYPDGKAYNVRDGILRARYREGFDKKVWMKEGQIYEVTIDLAVTSNYFAPGHRIRLELSSSNFPRFDRNLNTGGNNYDETEWVVAKNTVHHSEKHASYIILPIIPEK